MDDLRYDVTPTVIRDAALSADTGQSDGAVRRAAVYPGMGASAIWLGKVHNDPAYRSVPHHHAEAETAGYVLRGRARIYFGADYRDYYDLAEGDFVHVPAWMPHIECNGSKDAELVWLTARAPDNLVVNLADVDLPPGEYAT